MEIEFDNRNTSSSALNKESDNQKNVTVVGKNLIIVERVKKPS